MFWETALLDAQATAFSAAGGKCRCDAGPARREIFLISRLAENLLDSIYSAPLEDPGEEGQDNANENIA